MIWNQTQQQTTFLHRVNPLLDDEHRRLLDTALRLLVEKYSEAERTLKNVLSDDQGKRTGFHGFGRRVRRGKYAFLKDTLDGIIKDLENSHKRFDPTWFLIMVMANPTIDQQLKELNTKPKAVTTSGPLSSTEPQSSTGTVQTAPFSTVPISRESPLTLAQGVRSAIHSNVPPKKIMFEYQDMRTVALPYCTAVMAMRPSSTRGADQPLIIDTLRRFPGSNMTDLESDVRSLAKRLANSDPYTFGLLRCKGAMPIPRRVSPAQGYDLVLRVPDGMSRPTSLRQMLLNPEAQALPSLTRRLRIAQQLTSSVSYVHNFSFVHKGICPESILILSADAQNSVGQQPPCFTFLVGFGNFRAADGSTALIGDTAWEKNIYRHPERQGEYLQDAYRMQHDVYSLGVCLLEIGLWESFVEYISENELQKPKDSKSYQEFRAWVDSQMEIEKNETDPESERMTSQVAHSQRMSFRLREYLLHLAETRLPHTMGEMYKDVVVSCLSPGGDDWSDQEDDLQRDAVEDEGGIAVGVHFNEEILGKLAEITL